MERGKQICKILKDIRKRIAEENDIEFVTSECQHKGDCAGTCPKCEAEVRYLESQLARRRMSGRHTRIVGVSLGLAAVAPALLSCSPERGEPVMPPIDGEAEPPLTGDPVLSGDPALPEHVQLGDSLIFDLISQDAFIEAFQKGGWRQKAMYDVYPNGSLGEELMEKINGYSPIKFAYKDGKIKNYRTYNADPVYDYEILDFMYDEWSNSIWIGGLYNYTVASIDDEEMVCYGPVFSPQWAPEAFLGKYVFAHVSDETVAGWDELHSKKAE